MTNVRALTVFAAAHEFGHIALAMVGIPIGEHRSFHEGYADTFGNMVHDDSVQGRQQWMNGDNVRDDPTSSGINCQYPIQSHQTSACFCNEDNPHAAGQLLSGIWVRIRVGLKGYYGTQTGLSHARDLFGAWSLVTLGGGEDECNSAHEGTLAEVMSTTENYVELSIICSSFLSHSITLSVDCP